ncbi:zinc finger protein 260 isoform X8 [Cryptotermes secundus]|uniref:zinc finger protein 260 isoform X8 n=1 Tax=Cryptotermes secundus TaxID=105785 RepID=UPI000CD7DCF8|nr:zinc finger protein 260 isoform X8 [Cryptotermes secundus]
MMESSVVEGEEYYNPEGSEWTQKVENGQLCRVCASANEYLIPIFDGEGLEHELGMKIQKHLPIKVTETDNLPQQMCYQCASTLIAWHDLVISCVEADKKLRELQVEGEEDDYDDKGAEVFETPSLDSEMTDDVQASTSETQNQVSKIKSPKKTAVSKEKKPNLKMVLVKGPPPGSSGQKTASKTQVAKALELAKSKDSANQDSASERCSKYSLKQINALTSSNEEPSSNEEGTTEDCNLITKNASQSSFQELYDDLCAYEVFDLLEPYADYKEPNELEYQCVNSDDCVSDHNYILNDDCAEELIDISFESKRKPQSCQCQHCDRVCTSITSLKRHLKQEHKELKQFVCRVCHVTFMSKHSLQAHKATHELNAFSDTEEGVHLCHSCGKTFNASSKLRCHEKRAHQEIPAMQVCEKKHICEVCGLSFQFNRYLKKHMLKHGEKNFVCETCGKRFETNYKLKMHQECHSEQRPYACKICGSAYKRHRNLLSHEQEVHGIFSLGPGKEKESLSFPCDVCKKEFTTPKRAAAHMRIHTGERPFHCEQCGNTFRIYQSLMVHRRVVHEGRKVYGNKGLFPCHICRKIFSTKHYRDEHVRIHTGERPHICKICGRAFTHGTSLVQHTALHSDIRPYSCKLCEKAFRRRETLIIHIRTHTGEKPYVCDICGRGFAQLTDMKKHRLKIHNVPHQRRT